MIAATLTERAAALLKQVDFLYGVAAGFLLKYSFENAGNRSVFKRNEVISAFLAGLASLALVSVLVVLMKDVAIDSMSSHGVLDATLVVFVLTWFVFVVVGLLSLVAIWRALADLWHFKGDIFE